MKSIRWDHHDEVIRKKAPVSVQFPLPPAIVLSGLQGKEKENKNTKLTHCPGKDTNLYMGYKQTNEDVVSYENTYHSTLFLFHIHYLEKFGLNKILYKISIKYK